MKRSEGFTLIELLTVIAILAIILIISIPTILGVLEKSKKNNFKNQVLLYVDGLKKQSIVDEFESNSGIKLPQEGSSIVVNVLDIPMDSKTDISGNITVTNNNGEYTYILYVTDKEYKICNKEYSKIKVTDIEKGDSCGDTLLYPSITNKYESQTYNYKYNITDELIRNGVEASDTTDGNITNKITYTSNVNTSVLGDYEIIYRVENSKGNYITTKRIIHIKDIESPSITNTIEKEEINKGDTYNNYLNGIEVKDNYDSNIEATYICKNGILEEVECNSIGSKVGVYYIVYDAKDTSNNKYSETSNIEIKREIVVKDIDAPVITLVGEGVITIEVGSTYSEPGYTAIDDEDGDITGKVETSSNLNINKVGTYTIEYIVIDSSNNRGINTRTINVVDTRKPVITGVDGNPDSWVQSATLTIEATDNYKLHTQAYSYDDGSSWQEGNTKVFTENSEVKIKVRDESGNIGETYTVNITKIDSTEPTITLSGVPDTIKFQDSYSLPTSYTVNNNLSGGSAVCKVGNTVITNTSALNDGTHVVNCTVTTGVGKTANVSKTITVAPKDIYEIGDQVTLKDGSVWYVIERSTSSKQTLTLFASSNINNTATGWTTSYSSYKIAFDVANARNSSLNSYCVEAAKGCNIYAKSLWTVTNGSNSGKVADDSTIKTFLEGSVKNYINDSLISSGGTSIDSIRLITTTEICNIIKI